MIDPKRQWAIQIDVTNACTRACSNCTRFVGHLNSHFFMPLEEFARAAEALKDFPIDSPLSPPDVLAITGGRKMVGILGGEPLLHPEFSELARILERTVPSRDNRGLWTGLRWQSTKHAGEIDRVFCYVNNNRHDSRCLHSPILVATKDMVDDPEERRRLIDACWLQRMWSGTINPKGFWFCEVAGAMSMLFDGPDGLPVEPGCWRRPLEDFRYQIDWACDQCGLPLNLEGRPDVEELDDVSWSNLRLLEQIDSPRIQAGQYVLHAALPGKTCSEPWRYLQ
jgi:hypothetical protein